MAMLVSSRLLVAFDFRVFAWSVIWPASWSATLRVSPMVVLMSAYHVAASSPVFLTLPRPRAMLLVSDSALDRTCPGARHSLVPPEDGTSDHAAGVLAAAWTGLTWQATTSLRTRSPPWRYVTVSPPVRLGAVIRSSF